MKSKFIAALALLASMTVAAAAPCNGVHGCVVRAQMCRIEAPEKCHYQRLLPEQDVGLCTMVMMQAAVQWIVGDEASGKPAHPGFRIEDTRCVSPDEADL
jgi:hypothetical protein